MPRAGRRPTADPGLAIVPGTSTFTRRDGTVVTGGHDVSAANAEAALFKIPTLWGVANTAPYFHDNSAKDLSEVLDHYNTMVFSGFDPAARDSLGCGPLADQCLSEQDQADILAYLKLLAFEPEAGEGGMGRVRETTSTSNQEALP